MKVLVKINKNTFSFVNKKRLASEQKNMLNTNVINDNELVFSDEYILKNTRIVTSFLRELAHSYNITIASFQNIEIAKLMMPIVNEIDSIDSINLESDDVVTYALSEQIIKNYQIKFFSAEFIPQYIFELLNKHKIIVEARNEMLFTSKFMTDNNLNTYSSLYYKFTINMNMPLDENDIEDFETFCQINTNLKTIKIEQVNKDDLEKIINILKESRHRFIKIIIYGDIKEPEVIEYLHKYNKQYKKKDKIMLVLSYSKKYIKENIGKQTNLIILRICGLLMIFLTVCSISFMIYDNYTSMYKTAQIQEQLDEVIQKEVVPIEYIDNEESVPINNKYLLSIKVINEDIVGWLKVNDTKIDYPVVQSKDNEYYLKHNLNKEHDVGGWIFMDYENDPNNLDDNTIIYGHNRQSNGTMFGTLGRCLKKEWYTNEDNQIIYLDSLYHSYKFKIFSIYTVPTTSDYIKTSFSSEHRLDFYNMIKKRSIYNFGIELNENDKILSLSTCHGNTARLVVHAVLIEAN